METSEERSAGRRADARPGVSRQVSRTFATEPVKVGGLDERLAVDAQVALSNVVREDENQIGFLRLCKPRQQAGERSTDDDD